MVFSVSPCGNQVELIKQLEGHDFPITDVVTDTKGSQLVSADEQGTIILWQDISTSKEPSITINDSRLWDGPQSILWVSWIRFNIIPGAITPCCCTSHNYFFILLTLYPVFSPVSCHYSMCSGIPCLCLSFWNTFIIGGFANGQLRLYDSESGVKVVEVTAHARPVMALDVAPSAGMVSITPSSVVILWFTW